MGIYRCCECEEMKDDDLDPCSDHPTKDLELVCEQCLSDLEVECCYCGEPMIAEAETTWGFYEPIHIDCYDRCENDSREERKDRARDEASDYRQRG